MNSNGHAGHDRHADPADELDRIVDALIVGQETPLEATNPDLADLLIMARRVRALHETAWPAAGFPTDLATSLVTALRAEERGGTRALSVPARAPLGVLPATPEGATGRAGAQRRAERGSGARRLLAAFARRAVSVAALLAILAVSAGVLALVLPHVLRGGAAPTGTPIPAPPTDLYLSDAFDGSGLLPIDPRTLADRSLQALLGPAVTHSGSSSMVISPDRGTIAVTAYQSPSMAGGQGITIHVFDARTSKERATFHPAVPIIIDALSADGTQLVGRDWPPTSLDVPRYLLDAKDGRVLATLPAPEGADVHCATRQLVDPTGRRDYRLIIPGCDGPSDGPHTPVLVALDPRSGRAIGSLTLDGVLAGYWQTDRVVEGRRASAMLEPGLAISPDGRRIAVLHADDDVLTLIDTAQMRVLWSRPLTRPGGRLDWLAWGLRAASAKGIDEGGFREITFSTDGQRLYAFGTTTRLDAGGATVITPFDLRIIAADDRAGARILATGPTGEQINWAQPAPDGTALYVCVRQAGASVTAATLRRLDPASLAILAERQFPTTPQLYFLAAP